MGDWRLMFIDRDRMEQVTADTVRTAAAEYLINDNRTLGLFLPEKILIALIVLCVCNNPMW
jgi:zinc protease